MRKKLTALLVATILACPLALAQSADETLIKADALIKEGKPADAFAMLEPLEAKLAGNATYDYLLATAALNAGNPSRATFIYERILAINPEFIGVRADMGRAYYQMGDLARAKLEFESILSLTNIPPDLRSAVESYLAALSQIDAGQKRVIVGYAEVGFGRDTNVLGQTSNKIVSIANGLSYPLSAGDLKRPDNYLSYGAGAELIETLDTGLAAYAGIDVRGREHRQIDPADNVSVDGRIGLQYATGNHLFRGGVTRGRYVLDNTATRDSTGANLDWRYLVDAQNQFTLGGMAQANRYLPTLSTGEDFNLYMANAGWTHAITPTTIGVLTLTGGQEEAKADRADGNKAFWGARITLQHSFSASLGTFFTAGYQRGDYSKFNTSYGIEREDDLSDAALGLVWSLPDRWTVRPLVAFTKNRSNADIYTYSRRDASVVLRKDF
ncbi:MAG: tetratricopeptide repeat protein [Rhodocyclaceae bacterium]|nr:tetratricopeptide repeat protein [Rhodocyclaceae bacterium]